MLQFGKAARWRAIWTDDQVWANALAIGLATEFHSRGSRRAHFGGNLIFFFFFFEISSTRHPVELDATPFQKIPKNTGECMGCCLIEE